MIEDVLIYSDGGARGNPGPSGIGVVVCSDKGSILYEHQEFTGVKTNNQAEYTALIKALEIARDYKAKNVKCYMDSELLVKQLNGEYKVRNPVLRGLFQKARTLEKGFKGITYNHVPRTNEKIQIADRLVNMAIDGRVSSS